MGTPPRIGLPTYIEQARWSVWDRKVALLPASYLDAVADAGGVPVLLPPVDVDGGAVAAVDGLDALLLTGGADVDPALYGAERSAKTAGVRPDRDRWEAALVRAALERDLPVLAVCRGAQMLAVALGGTLHQHVPDVVGHDSHMAELGTYGPMQVKIEAGSRLASILGDTADVRCHHHQAIDALGEGLVVSASAEDGLIEAVEAPARRFVVGVQWHPEMGQDARLFAALVEAALSPS